MSKYTKFLLSRVRFVGYAWTQLLRNTALLVGSLKIVRFPQNPWPSNGNPDRTDGVDQHLDLMQKQLSKFPKLKSALFPAKISLEERLSKSVTVYHLLQSKAPYDPRKLFGWQSTNSVNIHYRTAEMPAFSNSDLQEKYGYKKELDYTYYLKSCRPSFAYWSFVSQLTTENFKDELMAGRDMAFFLAVFFFTDDALVASCVTFMEMLGIESLSTRINVEAARIIHRHQEEVSTNEMN